jgi:hypothetical protein
MRTAIRSVNGVGKGKLGGGDAIGVLQGNLHFHVVHLFLHIHRLMQYRTIAVEIAHKRFQPAFKVEVHFPDR